MQSPQHMIVIQIEITNACLNRCSNCTRFCGHHKKPFFMDFDTFKKAVASMEGYKGMVGVMGGEPTLHPDFEKFTKYICRQRGPTTADHLRKPVKDLQKYILENMAVYKGKVGLWSSLVNSYYKHFEVINDHYPAQYLNDHNNLVKHQALLMPRRELGVSDEEWIRKRDDCFVQKYWSASITPKGAFFCEIAASLDMLFNGPGGWEIEPGWWRREPSEFGDQLQWCELCSACLHTPHRLASDERDDMTPGMFKKLLELGSPKLKKGLFVIHDPAEYAKSDALPDKEFQSANDYMERGGNERFNVENRNLFPKSFCLCEPDYLAEKLKKDKPKDWVLVAEDPELFAEARTFFKSHVLNPGCLYIYKNDLYAFNVRALSVRDYIKKDIDLPTNIWGLYSVDKIINVNSFGEDEERDSLICQIEGLEINLEEERKLSREIHNNKTNIDMKNSSLEEVIIKLTNDLECAEDTLKYSHNKLNETMRYAGVGKKLEKLLPKGTIRRKIVKKMVNVMGYFF